MRDLAKDVFDFGVALNRARAAELTMDGEAIAASILSDAERIEREKHGQALLPSEADTVKAAHFLRKVMGI